MTEQVLEELQARIRQVEDNIAAAAQRVGRDPEAVTLLPVTKYVDADVIAQMVELGYTTAAESRVQDLRSKAAALAGLDVSWTLIGRLQSNKAGQVSRIVDQVQSVDSVRIAQALSRNLGLNKRHATALVQVNTSGEEAKAGFAPHEVAEALAQIRSLPNMTVTGLMTMAPFSGDDGEVRSAFRTLRQLRDDVAPDLPDLSMGMSQDYEIAVEEGATIVRVGSALFEG